MTTTYDDEGNPITADQQQEQQRSREFRENQRKLEQRAAKSDENALRAEVAERRLAFLEAGVDPNKPGATWFIKGYDGDLTAASIRKAAEQAGLLATQPAAPPTGQQQAQQAVAQQAAAGFGQIDSASAGAFGGITPVNHLENMQRALERGGIDAMADYMRSQGLPVTGDDQ